MRFDNIGFFWEDIEVAGVRNTYRPKPPIPESSWRPVRDYPNLGEAKVISFDTETYDPELKLYGAGWSRGSGHIVGFSLATNDGFKSYFPVRHEEQAELNLDPENTFRWLKDILGKPMPKVGANLIYDIGWLEEEGVKVKGELYDVQYAEALLTEDSSVALEVLGQKYLGIGKDSPELYQWCSDYFGGKPNPDQRANIYRAPITLTAPYAISDADLPIHILGKQWKLLKDAGLFELFLIECQLIPLMVKMRQRGVRVDIEQAESSTLFLKSEVERILDEIKKETGISLELWRSASLQQLFDTLKVPYPLTPKGAPSFTSGWLKGLDHPIGKKILLARQYDKLGSTFIQNYILNSHKDGIIHCDFNQLRGDGSGTRSGRFSSTRPNLQNIPVRSDAGREIRKIFVPFEGDKQWLKFDYSQIEYRFLAHFARGDGSDKVRDIYINDPDADFHLITQSLIKEVTGVELDRRHTKNINFGLSYGMGVKTLSEGLHLTQAKGRELFNSYHKGVPFVKATFDYYMQQASINGEVRTILNRRALFDKYEPIGSNSKVIPLPYAQAVKAYGGNIQRAKTYASLNRVLQGSSADLIKYAMLVAYKEGLFEKIGYPSITVHDELDFSDPGCDEKYWIELERILETCLPLKIPVKVDRGAGASWGEVD